jgi:hypothetical protein
MKRDEIAFDNTAVLANAVTIGERVIEAIAGNAIATPDKAFEDGQNAVIELLTAKLGQRLSIYLGETNNAA